jgi:hypothetical protein
LANFDTYTGTITASAQTIVIDAQNDTGVYCVFYGAAHAGVNLAFEGTVDGGTTWQSLLGYRMDSTATSTFSNATGVLTSNSNTQWYVLAGACKQFRVRSSAYTSGTLNVTLMPVTAAAPISTMMNNFSAPGALADGTANPTAGATGTLPFLYNGTTWDRQRNNITNQQVESSAARTTTGTGTTNQNYNWAGAFFQINVTAVSGTTPTLLVRVQYTVDGTNFYDLDTTNAQTASITTTGLSTLKVYPGLVNVASTQCNSMLPRQYRFAWTIGGTTPSFTFSIFASYNL